MNYQVKVNGQMLPDLQTLEQIRERAGRWRKFSSTVEVAAAGTQSFKPLDQFLSSVDSGGKLSARQFDEPFIPSPHQPRPAPVVPPGPVNPSQNSGIYFQPNFVPPPVPHPGPGPIAPTSQLPIASIGKRFAALMIDGFIITAIFVVGSILLQIIGVIMLLFWVAACLSFVLYNSYLLGRDGATIGKKLMKLKVLDEAGKPLGFSRALLRTFCQMFSGMILGLGYLMAFADSEKRALHDQIVGTRVYDSNP